jgi:hypothetical protein
MPDTALAERPARHRNDVVRGQALWLVEDENTVY